ncbi:MAG: helix-turn-helix transcriptional regulator [Pseudomonadota bacterium]
MEKNKEFPIQHSFHERIKELDCLYNVTRLLVDHKKSLEEIFQTVVYYLPSSWQYPDIACARIVFEGQKFVSAGFKTSKWKQSANIVSGSKTIGVIEVFYLKKMPVMDEGPFLNEERMLINAVAGHVSNAYKRIKLEVSLKERIKELDCLYGVSNVIGKYSINYKRILQEIVELLPNAWRYPEITCAKIIYNSEEFKTANYKKTPWKQIAEIIIEHQTMGFVEVAYTQKKPVLDEGPFLKEERLLINAVSERVSKALKRIRVEEALEIETIALENKNIALKEVIEKIHEEKKEIAKRVQANVDKIILPILSVFEKNAEFKNSKVLMLLKNTLEEVTAPFTAAISKEFMTLSPIEIQICHYIKNGFSTKDIAQLRGIAIATVSIHREHIRKKLNLTNKNINLVTYLNTFMAGKE